jgi:chromosome segregation ATPase
VTWRPVTHVELPEGVTIEQRVADLEARITSLGPINPLALDELATLEERYKDLDAQVSDVRHARRELQEVIRALDQEIMRRSRVRSPTSTSTSRR